MRNLQDLQRERQEKTSKITRLIKRGVFTLASVILASVVWASFTETISQGHVGVEFNKAKGGVQEEPLREGFQFVNPLSKITEYPVSTETVKYKLSLPTGDTKTITIPISFDYHNEANKTPDIYREWRGQLPKSLEEGYLQRNMLGIASEITSKYTILELNSNRGEIQTQIMEQFGKRVGKKGFVVTGINLGTPEYDAETTQAIQQVVNKQQELKAMELEKEKAQLEAEKNKIVAEGNAQKVLIEAEGQAKANKTLQQSITPELLKKMEMDARIQHGWVTVQAGQAIVDSKK